MNLSLLRQVFLGVSQTVLLNPIFLILFVLTYHVESLLEEMFSSLLERSLVVAFEAEWDAEVRLELIDVQRR